MRWAQAIELGVGASSIVFKVMLQGVTVAAKLMQRVVASQQEASLSQLRQEVRVAKEMRHPHIVTCFGISTDDPERVCVLLEIAPFGSLRSLLDRTTAVRR